MRTEAEYWELIETIPEVHTEWTGRSLTLRDQIDCFSQDNAGDTCMEDGLERDTQEWDERFWEIACRTAQMYADEQGV